MTNSAKGEGDKKKKVAYGVYGNNEVRKQLHEMLWTALRSEFNNGETIPNAAVNMYFLGETYPDDLLHSVMQSNNYGMEEEDTVRRKLYKALRTWIDYGQQSIKEQKMGEFYDPERLKEV